jgi:YggT family protein
MSFPMDVLFVPLLKVIMALLSLYGWAVLGAVILTWLNAFNIINGYNRFVFLISAFLFKITEPALYQLRKVVPNIGGVDLSPMALLLLIWFLQEMLARLILKFI